MQQAQPSSILQPLKKAINEAVEAGLSPLAVPQPLRLSEWADENFYLSAESSSVQGAWETLPYQRAIMNAISNDDTEIVTWQKSARVGYTKIICAAVGYFAEHKHRNQVIYQPTDSDAEDFVKDEIDPLIRDVPVVRNAMKVDPDKKSKHNTLAKKSFKGSSLDIRGGKSGRNYRRLTKDVVFYDELDGFDHDIEGEGSPIKLGDTRITTSSFPKSVRGSTPKVKGASQTESSLSQANMVFARHLPCPECGELHPLKWANMQWVDNDPATTGHACESCGTLADYSQYPEMDKGGRWVAECGTWIDDGDQFRSPKGKVVDAPRHIGFTIWAAYSYFKTWQALVTDFIEANQAAKTGDTTQLKTFVNTILGESWEEEGEQVEGSALYTRREHYQAEAPEGTLVLTAGVDVQDDRLEMEVTGWGIGEESWSIDYTVLHGDPGNQELWKRLEDHLATRYENPAGVQMGISCTCVDSGGHYTQQVYKFCKKHAGNRVFAIKGKSVAGSPIVGKPSTSNKLKIKLFGLGVDTAKQLIYSRLKVEEPGPGYCHWPVSDKFDQAYFDQLTAEKVVTRFYKGFPKREWIKIRPRNEALDCRVYSMAAMIILNPAWKALAKRISDKQEKIAAEKANKTSKKPQARRNKQPGGFVKGWK